MERSSQRQPKGTELGRPGPGVRAPQGMRASVMLELVGLANPGV